MRKTASRIAIGGLVLAASTLVLASSSCTSTSTTCAVDDQGNQVCASYASAYPYDYAYVDPLYVSSSGYYPYTFDTYYDPFGYSTLYYLTAGGSPVSPAAIDGGLDPVPDGGTPAADGGTPTMGSNVPELLDVTRKAANALNVGVRAALDPIKDLIKVAPSQSEATLKFGPMDRNDGNYQFTIRRLSTADQSFGWKLEARPRGSSGGFTIVAGGLIKVGDTPRRGRGVLGVDCDAMSAADSSVTCRGKLRIGFADTGTTKILSALADAFTPDPARVPPADTAAFAWRQNDTSNAIRIATNTNLSFTDTAAPEWVVIKLRWQKDVGVRADAVLSGGDIAAGSLYTASTCVPPDLDQSQASTVVQVCDDTGANCTLDDHSPAMTLSCPAGLDTAELPTANPTDLDPPAGVPEMPTIPPTVPTGDG